MRKALGIIRGQKRPARFIFSRLLMKSGLNNYFDIKRNKYILKFHNSALAADLWVNKGTRQDDENLLKNYCTDSDVVLDIGANIGSVSLSLASYAKEIYAFEPHPKIYKYLENNITLNKASNIYPFNIGLGETEGTLYFSDKSDDSQNCIKTKGDNEIIIRTLDKLLENGSIAPPQIIKIDVEGYEAHVLSGAKKTCESARVLYAECIDESLEKYGASEEKLVNIIKSYGFEVNEVSGENLTPYTPHSQVKKMLLCTK